MKLHNLLICAMLYSQLACFFPKRQVGKLSLGIIRRFAPEPTSCSYNDKILVRGHLVSLPFSLPFPQLNQLNYQEQITYFLYSFYSIALKHIKMHN
jgi:hypothetical protein